MEFLVISNGINAQIKAEKDKKENGKGESESMDISSLLNKHSAGNKKLYFTPKKSEIESSVNVQSLTSRNAMEKYISRKRGAIWSTYFSLSD